MRRDFEYDLGPPALYVTPCVFQPGSRCKVSKVLLQRPKDRRPGGAETCPIENALPLPDWVLDCTRSYARISRVFLLATSLYISADLGLIALS